MYFVSPPGSPQTQIHARIYAFPAFLPSLLTVSLLTFFATITPNLSKSLNPRLASTAARFCAQDDLFHFSTICSFSRSLRTTPVPAARGRVVRRMGVRVRCL